LRLKGFERTRARVDVIDDDNAKAKDNFRVAAARRESRKEKKRKEKRKRKLLSSHNFSALLFHLGLSVSPLIYSDTRVPVGPLLCHGIFVA